MTTMITSIIISFLIFGFAMPVVNAHGTDDHSMPMMPDPESPDMGHMPGYMMGDEAIWIKSDVITIMAMKEMPVFHYWYTADSNGSIARFMAAYTMISEFEDENEDGAFQLNESLYRAPLGAYEWTLQSGEKQNAEGATTEVWLKYTKSGIHSEDHQGEHGIHGVDMMPSEYYDEGGIGKFEDLTLQIWAHIYFGDHHSNISDTEGIAAYYTVDGGTELKIDIMMGNYEFTSNTSQLALQTMLRENLATNPMMQEDHMFRTHEHFQNITMDSMMDWMTNYGNETRFDDIRNSHMQQIDFIDTSTGNTQGFYKWLDKAVISWPGGTSEAVNVTASYVSTHMGLSLIMAYPNFGNGSILHDPSLGLVEGEISLSQLNIPMLATIIVVVSLAIAVIVLFGIRKR